MTVKVINADVMNGLAQLPDESVHCVVTSPPYWGLRDYGTGKWEGGDINCDHKKVVDEAAAVASSTLLGGKKSTGHIQEGFKGVCGRCGAVRNDGQIGLEPTLQDHIVKIVDVFREVRRVLRKDGTLWFNYGDAYATGGGSSLQGKNGQRATRRFTAQNITGNVAKASGLKPKDLMLMPERIAIALCDDGWYIRSRIIWAKPNPMPESVTDRPTKSHEHIWLMSKSPRYFYDADAIRETATYDGPNSPESIASPYGQGFTRRAVGAKGNANTFRGGSYVGGEPGPRTVKGNTKQGKNETDPSMRTRHGFNQRWNEAEANGTAPISRNCRDVWMIATSPFPESHFATFPPELAERCIKAGCPMGGVVLDPFGGAGTTGLVADRLQRNAILIKLNPTYAEMARNRVSKDRGALLDLMEEPA